MSKRWGVCKVELRVLRPVVVLVARRRAGARDWRGKVGRLRSRSRDTGGLRSGLDRRASLAASAAIAAIVL